MFISAVFNVGEYRRKAVGLDRLHEFFKHDNREAQEIRKWVPIKFTLLQEINTPRN